MIKANQNALSQQTNIGLLNIRSAEMNYYINLNIAFGTQAALIGGFSYGIFTQNPINMVNNWSNMMQNVFWILSAGTIATSIHVILATMVLQVLGPGMALYGPIGSMARACEGMRIEQKSIIFAFILMMVFFSLSTLLTFWYVFTVEAAVGSTIVWAIACRQYYYYCNRIYLRFYWKEEADYLNRDNTVFGGNEMDKNGDDDEPPVYNRKGGNSNPIHDGKQQQDGNNNNLRDGKSSDSRAFLSSTNHSVSTLSRVIGVMTGRSASGTGNELTTKSMTNKSEQGGGDRSASACIMEGFMSIKVNNKSWDRCFMVLTVQGYLYQYKSRFDYRNNASQPIFKRPIDVNDHYVTVFNSELQQWDVSETESDAGITTASKSKVAGLPSNDVVVRQRFQLKMIPKDAADDRRYGWVLRCDTSEELTIWEERLREVAPDSFLEAAMYEIV